MGVPRKSKIHTGVRIPPTILKKMGDLIESEEYLNKSDIIIDALEFFFNSRNKPSQKEEFKAWLVSVEGETYMKNLIRKVKEKK
jgi:Arc/MetJ-type ribon-helix-helix transcriptional regulator